MTKERKMLKISNIKHILFGFIFLMLATIVNNYFFYKHAARDIDRDIIHRALDIKTFASTCSNSHNNEECVLKLKEFIKNTPLYYQAKYEFFDKSTNEEIFSLDDINQLEGKNTPYSLEYIQKNRNLLRFDRLFKAFDLEKNDVEHIAEIPELNLSFNIKKNSIPSLSKSVYHSLTFSVGDWIPILIHGDFTQAYEFIVKVAFPRSWPAIFFALMALLLAKYIHYEEKKHKLALQQADKKMLEKIHQSKPVGLKKDDLAKYKQIIEKVIPTQQLIDFLETYPQGVVTECRKISEMFVKMLPGNCDDENQAKKIECLYQKGFIDKKTKSNLHTIRILGNTAVHDSNVKISKSDALIALNALISVFNSPFIAHKRSQEK